MAPAVIWGSRVSRASSTIAARPNCRSTTDLGAFASAKSGDVYPLHRSTVDSVQVLLQLRGFHLYTQDYLALDLFNLRYFH